MIKRQKRRLSFQTYYAKFHPIVSSLIFHNYTINTTNCGSTFSSWSFQCTKYVTGYRYCRYEVIVIIYVMDTFGYVISSTNVFCGILHHNPSFLYTIYKMDISFDIMFSDRVVENYCKHFHFPVLSDTTGIFFFKNIFIMLEGGQFQENNRKPCRVL